MDSAIPLRVGAYKLPSGTSPFKVWLTKLRDPLGKALVIRRLERVAQGSFGDHKGLGRIGELRIHTGPGYRVYFGRDGRDLVVLLAGGDKGSQARDIAKAEEYWDDYQARKEKEGALDPV